MEQDVRSELPRHSDSPRDWPFRSLLALCLAATAVVGCGNKSPQPGTERGPCAEGDTCNTGLECRSGLCVSAKPAGVESSAASDKTDEPTDEDEVKDLFQRWLDTQNEGDFEGYATTFAREFTGVRRSGSSKCVGPA